jgi:hypothetical protein
MYLSIAIWLIVASSALAFIYILRRAYARARDPKPNPNDAVHYLYPVDWALLESLLDPAADFALRWSLDSCALRAERRRRMRLYRELVRRMAHNSSVLADFDDALFADSHFTHGPDSKLRQAIIKVRFYCAGVRLKLGVWLLLPDAFGLVPTPDLASLRKAVEVDGPKAYDELRVAAVEAFARLRPNELEALTRGL